MLCRVVVVSLLLFRVVVVSLVCRRYVVAVSHHNGGSRVTTIQDGRTPTRERQDHEEHDTYMESTQKTMHERHKIVTRVVVVCGG